MEDYDNDNRPLDFVISSKDRTKIYVVGLARYDGDRGGAQEDDRTGGYKNCSDEILEYVYANKSNEKGYFFKRWTWFTASWINVGRLFSNLS